jgi:hypothetical protein
MLYARNMGKIKNNRPLGANAYSAIRTPLSILMQIIYFFFRKQLQHIQRYILSPRTNLFALDYREDGYVRSAGTVTGFEAVGDYNKDSKFIR